MANYEQEIKTLPAMTDEYLLTEQQINDYQAKGHIFLSAVARPDEISVYEPIISHWVKELNNQDKPLEERDTYGKAFIQVGNLWRMSKAVVRFTLARRYAKLPPT